MILHSKTTAAIPPGVTIHEQLGYRKMSQKEFAIRMDLSEKHISRLINGKVELTFDVAQRLEDVLGAPASFWNGLEMNYREQLIKVKQEVAMEQELELAHKFPYGRMSALQWVPETSDKKVALINLRKFFEVANLEVLYNLNILQDESADKNYYFEVAKKQQDKNEGLKKLMAK